MRFNLVKPSSVGALLWISSIQYFIVQLIVISAWTVPHSWANNFISDLGNTECGMYAGLAVCSPLHLLMNTSFVLYGLTITGGAVLLRGYFEHRNRSLIAFSLMVASGIGTVMVGLFPENTVSQLHTLGAFLGLGAGNLSVLLLGLALMPLPRAMRVYTILSGIVSLSAFALFIADIYLGIGRGGMERLISYPFTAWIVCFGFYVLRRASRGQ